MTVTGNNFTVAEIDRAVDRVNGVLAKLPEGAVNAATIHLLMELYLGAIDKSKEDNQQAKSASN